MLSFVVGDKHDEDLLVDWYNRCGDGVTTVSLLPSFVVVVIDGEDVDVIVQAPGNTLKVK